MSAPNPPDTPTTHPVVDGINAFMKGLPTAKITAPMVVAIIGLYFIGNWLKDLYLAPNHVAGSFPTDKALWSYLISGLVLIGVYLGLSIFHMKKNVKQIK